jgi:Tfp pilus assembly protein PilF
MRRLVMLLLGFAIVFAAHAQEPEVALADAAYKAQRWDESIQRYEAIAKAHPERGQAWYRLGTSLHHQGKLEGAIAAYQHAVEVKFAPPFTAYNLAAAYALQKDKAHAYEWLDRAVAAGFRDDQGLSTDTDFAILKDEPRFVAAVAAVKKTAHPCSIAEYQALDFWLGEWKVRDTRNGNAVGTSRIEKILDDCVVLENWIGGMGGTGKSFNTIDPATKKWRQTWVDSSGQIFDFTGETGSSKLIYSRTAVGADGKKLLSRMTLAKQANGEVQQLGEQSVDGGKTWSTTFDFMYAK